MLREYLRRLALLIGGLAVSAVGITLMLQANIGLEPWSVLQNGMSIFFGITYGTAAMIVGAVVIAIAFFCGESFGIGTLANIFVCPVFIDILLYLDWIPLAGSLWTGLAMLLIGGTQAYTVVWDLGDVGIGLMTLFNLIALYPLAGQALACLADYEAKHRKK